MHLFCEQFKTRLRGFRFSRDELTKLRAIIPSSWHTELRPMALAGNHLTLIDMQQRFDALPRDERFAFLQMHETKLLEFVENGGRLGYVLMQLNKEHRSTCEKWFAEKAQQAGFSFPLSPK